MQSLSVPWARMRARVRALIDKLIDVVDKPSPFVSDLRRYAAFSPSLPANQDKSEVRIYAALLTAVAGYFLALEPVFVLLTVPQSPMFRIASTAPSVWCVVTAYLVCCLGLIPHLISLVFTPKSLSKRWPRSLAAKSSFGAAVTWLYMANLSLPLDYGSIEWAYGLRALGSVMLGFSYGFSVNAQQGRELIHAKTD